MSFLHCSITKLNCKNSLSIFLQCSLISRQWLDWKPYLMLGVCLPSSNWNAKCNVCKNEECFWNHQTTLFYNWLFSVFLSQIECMVATEIMQRYRQLQFEKGKWKAAVCSSGGQLVSGSSRWGTCAFVDGELHACCPRWLRVTHCRQIGRRRCMCEDERDVNGLALDTCTSSWPHAVAEWRLLPVLAVCLTMIACHLPTPTSLC